MTLVRTCDECSCKLLEPFLTRDEAHHPVGTTAGKCIICGSPGKPSSADQCEQELTQQQSPMHTIAQNVQD